MSNLRWLKDATAEKAQDIIDVADEFWDAIVGDVDEAPSALKDNPHTIGKFGVVGTLGMMMYFPGMAEEIAQTFGRASSLKTGARSNIKGKGYVAKVSQGLDVSSQMVAQWFEGQEGAPRIGQTETTEDMLRLLPLFREQVSDQIAKEKEIASGLETAPSLLMTEGEADVPVLS